MLKPFTRDAFSSCIKACYAEVNGQCCPVFKNPKDVGFKKLLKDYTLDEIRQRLNGGAF